MSTHENQKPRPVISIDWRTATVDDLITRGRDKTRLRLASRADIERLQGQIKFDDQDGTQPKPWIKRHLSPWNLVAIDQFNVSEFEGFGDMPDQDLHLQPDGSTWTYLCLLGNDSQDYPWCTSHIKRIDLSGGLVLTNSGSLYGLIGNRAEGALDERLLRHLNTTLWYWGMGQRFGLPNGGF